MRTLFAFFLGCMLLCFGLPASGQVVMRDFLSQDHSGQIPNSVNFKGKPIDYSWQFVSMDKGNYFAENEAIQRIYYKLILSVGGNEKITFDVNMRDLIVTLYIEIKVSREGDTRTISAIYNKTNKWLKIKAVLHEGCKNEANRWRRLEEVSSFDQLLRHIVEDLDRNVKIGCYLPEK